MSTFLAAQRVVSMMSLSASALAVLLDAKRHTSSRTTSLGVDHRASTSNRRSSAAVNGPSFAVRSGQKVEREIERRLLRGRVIRPARGVPERKIAEQEA